MKTKIVFLALILLAGSVWAAEKTFFISGTNINSLGTAVNASGNQIVLTKNSGLLALTIPGTLDPITNFSIIEGTVDTLGSPAGRNVQVDCDLNDTLAVRLWSSSTIGLGGYYGDRSLTMNEANYNDSALTWNWDNFAVDFKAAVPYQPNISQFEEVTTDYTDLISLDSSTLKVTSVPGSGTDGRREVNNYAWKMWLPGTPDSPETDEPLDPRTGATSAVLELNASDFTAGNTYAFRAQHANSWGTSVWSEIRTYRVVGVGAGAGSITIPYDFNKTAILGVNQFSVPLQFPLTYTKRDGSTLTVSTVAHLVAAINDFAAGLESSVSNAVTTFGWWDETTQQPAGYAIAYSGSTPGFTNHTAELSDDGSQTLTRDKVYQISIAGTVRNFQLSGVRE